MLTCKRLLESLIDTQRSTQPLKLTRYRSSVSEIKSCLKTGELANTMGWRSTFLNVAMVVEPLPCSLLKGTIRVFYMVL